MYDEDLLKREHRKMLVDLGKQMRRSERRRRKEERRLHRDFERTLKCQNMPSTPCKPRKTSFFSRTLGFFLASLVLALGVLV
jgi:hypothetical protein